MIAPQWQMLESKRGSGSSSHFESMSSEKYTSEGEVLYALGRNSELALLMPVSRGVKRKYVFSDAIDVEFSQMTVDQKNSRQYLVIQCAFKELRNYFSQFVEAILDNVSAKRESFETFIETYEKFRHLLTTHRLGVPVERIVGLVGELIVLDELSGKGLPLLECWYGPEGEYHDIELPQVSIEVKTSRRCNDSNVKISSLSQLDSASGKPLYLWHVNLQKAPDGEFDVSGLCRKLIENGHDESLLKDKLSELDCYDFDADEWNYLKFQLCNQQIYLVDEKFPKIIPATLQNDLAASVLNDVSYTLDLSYINDWKLSQDDFFEINGFD